MKSCVRAMCLAGLLTSMGAGQSWRSLPTPPPMPKAVRSGYAEVNGIRMYFATFGRGAPILLIHNGLGSADDWGGVTPLLAKHYQVIVADSRGFGRSSRDDRPYSYHLMADDYLALLDYLHIPKVLLAGTSDGGIIGLDIAIHHPERLSGLFVQGANANVQGIHQRPSELQAIRLALARARAEYLRLSATPGEYVEFRKAVDAMDETQPAFTTAELARIQTRTVVAVADHEESVTEAHSEYLVATIPGARLERLQGVSHFAPLQNPRQFAEAVEKAARTMSSARH